MIQSFAFVSEQRSFVCNAVPLKPSNEPSGTMVHVWVIFIRPLKQETQTRLCQIRIQEPGGDLANRQPSWCFSIGHISETAAGMYQECFLLHHWSLWRGLRIFQGPRPTKVPARYLHVNKPPLRNYCWCFCALPLQNLTANYAMATLSTPFARMWIITVSTKLFSSCTFLRCALQIQAVRGTRQSFATYHYLSFRSGLIHVSLVYHLKGAARVALVKMSSASAVSTMQTSNNF